MAFERMLIWFGVLLLVIVTGDLVFRGLQRHPSTPVFALPGDRERGRELIEAYGCGGCHVIPGIRTARGRVGPRLSNLAEQMYLGGQLENTPENLVAWIVDPQGIAPGTAMPWLGVTLSEAQDMAAYLFAPD